MKKHNAHSSPKLQDCIIFILTAVSNHCGENVPNEKIGKYQAQKMFTYGTLHYGVNISKIQIVHISRKYLITNYWYDIFLSKIQKNPENPENIESG